MPPYLPTRADIEALPPEDILCAALDAAIVRNKQRYERIAKLKLPFWAKRQRRQHRQATLDELLKRRGELCFWRDGIFRNLFPHYHPIVGGLELARQCAEAMAKYPPECSDQQMLDRAQQMAGQGWRLIQASLALMPLPQPRAA